jgi:hypothetical protein
VIYANIVGAILFLGALAYLAIFTRYMSDDYCETVMVTVDSPVMAVVNRYAEGKWRAANRISNLLFVGFVERLGDANVQFVPIVMLALWIIGLIWLIQEIQKTAKIRWHNLTPFFLGTLLAFFSAFEAPNRYQVFYWRSSMATHFAPLVFLNFLIAYLLLLIRSAKERKISTWIYPAFFFASFIIAGFSEPPNTVIIVSVGLAFFGVLFFAAKDSRRPALNLLASVFLGAVSALVVMAVSPAVAQVSKGAPSFVEWVYRTTEYTYLFAFDLFKSFPTPTLLSVVASVLFFYLLFRDEEKINARPFLWLALLVPAVALLLVAAGFSTSAYGQSYPVGRARFFAHFLMIAALMFDGALLGTWLSQLQLPTPLSSFALYASLFLLFIFAFYPLRAGLQTLRQDAPVYRARALAWDERDAIIRNLKAQGKTDLIVDQFDGVGGTKELDTCATHWVNKCAAQYYGVKSIQAIPNK